MKCEYNIKNVYFYRSELVSSKCQGFIKTIKMMLRQQKFRLNVKKLNLQRLLQKQKFEELKKNK